MKSTITRGHALIAAAIVAAGIIVAVTLGGGESCADYEKRRDRAFVEAISGSGSHRDYDRIRSERPAGC